ncbi:MAG TPA: hypothetical protein VKY89_18300 [Thermoanaerobaculia bacterium]|nr:hypothetical protein [Thermoanaerobaculia bacterium]
MRDRAGSRASIVAVSALRRSVGALAAVVPRPGGRLRWRELGNRLEAFEIFRRAALAVRRAPAAGGEQPLAALVEHARLPGTCQTLWTIEGLGYGHAELRADRGAELRADHRAGPGEWLAAAAGLPASSLIALHCGVGLSLARRRLAATAGVADAALRRELAAYLTACREIAPTYAAALIEALGFIARLQHPRRAGELAGELARLDRDAHACFWHGIGRGLYFVPGRTASWTSTPWRAIAALTREVPQGEARDHALAGLAWAATMVNLRHPQVMAEILRRNAADLAAAPGFAHGVGSALLVCHDCAPDDPCLAAWRGQPAQPAGGELAGLWRRHVSGPAEAVLAAGRLERSVLM